MCYSFEQLFKQRIVSVGICGDWVKGKDALEQPDKHYKKKDILSIAERYNEVTFTWAGFNEKENRSSLDEDDYFKPTEMPVRAESKIGRNSPCSCGSGKKYKKCCLNK